MSNIGKFADRTTFIKGVRQLKLHIGWKSNNHSG